MITYNDIIYITLLKTTFDIKYIFLKIIMEEDLEIELNETNINNNNKIKIKEL